MRFQPSLVLATALLTLAASGCGQSPSPQPREGAAKHVRRAPVVTRAPGQAYDKRRALDGLTALSSLVGRESRSGHLSEADRQGLRAGIARARRRVGRDLEASRTKPAPPAARGPAAGK
jgi:hypothetical protein